MLMGILGAASSRGHDPHIVLDMLAELSESQTSKRCLRQGAEGWIRRIQSSMRLSSCGICCFPEGERECSITPVRIPVGVTRFLVSVAPRLHKEHVKLTKRAQTTKRPVPS